MRIFPRGWLGSEVKTKQGCEISFKLCTVSLLPRRAILRLPVPNAGNDQQSTRSKVIENLGLSRDTAQKLLQFSAINELIIANAVFHHTNARRATWISPDGKSFNQFDYILVKNKHKGRFKNCRSYRSAGIGSDHFMILASLDIKIGGESGGMKAIRGPCDVNEVMRYDIDKVHAMKMRQEFKENIDDDFEPLLKLDDKLVKELWLDFKETTNEITERWLASDIENWSISYIDSDSRVWRKTTSSH